MHKSLVVLISCIASTSVPAQVVPGANPPASQVPPLPPSYLSGEFRPENIKPDPCDTQPCFRSADSPASAAPEPNTGKVVTNAIGNGVDAENVMAPFVKPGLVLPEGVRQFVGPGVDAAKVYQTYQEALVKCGAEECAKQAAMNEALASGCGTAAGVVTETLVAMCGAAPLAPAAGVLAKQGMEAVIKADLDDPNFPAEIEAAMRCDPFTGLCLPPPDPSDNRQNLESQYDAVQTTNEQAAQQQAAQTAAAQQAQQQQGQSSSDSGSDPLLMLGILQGALQSSATPKSVPAQSSGGSSFNVSTTPRTSNPPPTTAPICTTQSCMCPGPGSTSVK